MSSHEAIPRDSTGAPGRIEVITGHERRRRYSDEDKARLVAEAAQPGQGVHAVARRHGVCSSLLYRWRRDGVGGSWHGAPAQRLIPVQVASAEHRAVPVPPQPPAMRVERLVEITLPNGCSVRVDQHVDGKALRRILAALRG
jgi:transposase